MPGSTCDNCQGSNKYSVHFTWSDPGDCHKCKVLGVDISSGLTWNSHIDRITGNANRTLGYIRRNIKTKNQKVRETAYNTLVRSQLEYSAPVWDPSSKHLRPQLEKIQRRAARWTTSNYDTRSSVTAMLNQLGWRTLEQRRADARLCLFCKIVYGLVAVPLPNYVQPTHRISRYCHSMTYRQIQTSTNYSLFRTASENRTISGPPSA